MLYVVDASAIAPLAFADEADRIDDDQRLLIVTSGLAAPAHWPVEVANMLLVALRRKRITDGQRVAATKHCRALSVKIDDEGANAIWSACFEIAAADGLTMYDAAYLELARRKGCGLLTLDAALAKAARARGVSTPLVP
ncbi:MAG TPA: type II toxin-antitoxin system VapC family toxin [Sphingobium sp.]